eukprot:IDg9301t1
MVCFADSAGARQRNVAAIAGGDYRNSVQTHDEEARPLSGYSQPSAATESERSQYSLATKSIQEYKNGERAEKY